MRVIVSGHGGFSEVGTLYVDGKAIAYVDEMTIVVGSSEFIPTDLIQSVCTYGTAKLPCKQYKQKSNQHPALKGLSKTERRYGRR